MQFFFDRDFDADLDTRRPLPEARLGQVHSQADFDRAVEAARREGYSDGRAAGLAEASVMAEDTVADRRVQAMEAVVPALAQVLADADAHHAVLERQMIDYVLSVFRQVAPRAFDALARDQALHEAEAAVRMALGSATLRLYLAPDGVEDATPPLTQAARRAGYAGRLEVKPDPDLAPGDVRADWDHGVMRYSFNDICDRILTALAAAEAEAAQKAGTATAEAGDH